MTENVLYDVEIEFAEDASLKKHPDKLRLVRFHDTEQKRDFAFLTNDFSLPSLKVANLYRSRCKVELFFKWLKQHLKNKKFWVRDGKRCTNPDEYCDHNLRTCHHSAQ